MLDNTMHAALRERGYPELLTAEHVAEIFDVGITYVRNQGDRFFIPSIKTAPGRGGCRRWRLLDVAAFVDAQLAASQTKATESKPAKRGRPTKAAAAAKAAGEVCHG